ncbi:MAG TPA: hypothetical protein VG733_08650, partial [Chthoniobacteraceae bacterium]|nr:hypothetical protein [Chthoniobacteraceae bacterium]
IANVESNSPDLCIATLKKLCAINANSYIELGDYLAKQNRTGEAADAYREAFAKTTDRILFAAHNEWIIDYDYTHDRKDEAEQIATEGAEVYSMAGLESMARLLEREDKLPEAEQVFVAIRERYSEPMPLAAFYFRHKEDPRFAASAVSLTKSLFPNGIEKAALADFTAPPTDGVLIKSNSALLHQYSLAPGDVFVAIDGMRVHNMNQYTFGRMMSEQPDFSVIAWTHGHYIEVKASIPHHLFGCDIGDYSGK